MLVLSVVFSFVILKGKILLIVNACTFVCKSGLLQLYDVLNWFSFSTNTILKVKKEVVYIKTIFPLSHFWGKLGIRKKRGYTALIIYICYINQVLFHICHYYSSFIFIIVNYLMSCISAAFAFFFTTRKKTFHIVG